MKKLFSALLALVSLVLILAACTSKPEILSTINSSAADISQNIGRSPAMLEPQKTVHFVQDNVNMGISVGCIGETSLQDVENALKTRDVSYVVSDSNEEVKFISLNDNPDTRWSFYFNGDALYMIYIFDKTFVTPEGFAIGDTVEKMKDMYGSNYQQLEDETVVITTEFKYNGISFFVHSNDGKDFSPVYMIKYGDWIE